MVKSEFDAFALNYDEALGRGIGVSGEGKEFFAKGRLEHLGRCLAQLRIKPERVLDFGCGTGSSIPYLLRLADSVKGVDVSCDSLEVARSRFAGNRRVELEIIGNFREEGAFDLVFCNGVFHHIPVDQREAAVGIVYRALKPGGLFAFWENNPWNPGTRLVMSRIPFDRDAVTLSPPEARWLLQSHGFEIVRQDFHFYFPRCLSALRVFESILKRVPLGAQYQILSRKIKRPE